jgi:hypothetical protein
VQKPYEIYCDLDGVLANFYTHTRNILGYSWDDPRFGTKERRIERGKFLSQTKRFWEDMPPERDFDQLWNFIKNFNPSILTAYPEWDDEGAKRGKWIWIQKHCHGIPADKFHCVERASKQYFAKEHDGSHFGKPNVLIDDMPQNILEWERRGGIGIHHTAAVTTINRLKELGFTTHG